MKQCPKCGIMHDKPGKYCSRKCANSRTFSDETNAKRAESNRIKSLKYWEDKHKVTVCKGCGVTFKYRSGKTFCSSDCRSALTKPPKERNEKEAPLEYTTRLIESGELHLLKESVIRKHMKRYLVDLYGHKCMICGISEWMGKPVPLVCDHIDGDSTNSEPNNFRNVCCNCDAQLDTYKSKNRGRGRSYDRNYYRKKMESEADRRAATALKAAGP